MSNESEFDSVDDSSLGNVYNLFTGHSFIEQRAFNIIQIIPETSGIRMLYSSEHKPERLIAVPILCWGLRQDGEIVGLVPWINELTDCTLVNSHLGVTWEGYYYEPTDDIFFEAPAQIVSQLTALARFTQFPSETDSQFTKIETTSEPEDVVVEFNPDRPESSVNDMLSPIDNSVSHTEVLDAVDVDVELDMDELEEIDVVQEIPDLIGTHALLLNNEKNALTLAPIISWVLDDEGELHGMLADEENIDKTPVLPGDDCLYSAASDESFRCYFQRDIAEQIRCRNPETMEAIEKLLGS